jgi:NAD(P)-dependent dehydrogenase (short-subunit alcohol dehydrogenase family)
MRIEGKVAVVTGGARGIGAAICRRYADEGARVVVADVLAADARALAAEIGRDAFAVPVDVTSRASIDALVETVVAEAGGIDILVNNAAIFDMAPLLEITDQSFDSQFAINVKGLLFTSQAVAKRMIEQGRGGKIVNFASQAGRRGEAFVAVYCATKAAVISLTQSMGLELIRHRINVNAIAPGVIDTPMWERVDAQFAKWEGKPIGQKKREVGAAVPYGRFGTPEEVAALAAFLVSPDADYIVAQTYNVDGGNWMS